MDPVARWDLEGPEGGRVDWERRRIREQGAPAMGMASASHVVAKSQVKLPKAQFKVVQGWSWPAAGQRGDG